MEFNKCEIVCVKEVGRKLGSKQHAGKQAVASVQRSLDGMKAAASAQRNLGDKILAGGCTHV